MAYRGKVLVVVVAVFLCLVLEQQVTFVNGDEQLIESACAEASKLSPCDGCTVQFVLACGNCFKYAPGGLNLDLQGLGQRAIKCTINALHEAGDLAYVILGKSTQFNQSLPPFSVCMPSLDNDWLQMTSSVRSLVSRRYADAIATIQLGAKTAAECSDELKKYEGTQDLVNQIATFQLLRSVTIGVIRQLH